MTAGNTNAAGNAGAAAAGANEGGAGGIVGAAGGEVKPGAETPEQKAAAEKAAADKQAGAEIELKFPEGFKADEAQIAEFKKLGKELGLDSAKAQKLFDFNGKFEQARLKAQDAALDAQEKAWAKEVSEDPEFGGKNFEGSKIALGKFLAKYDPTGVAKKLIGESGLGSHPVLVKFLFGLARAAAEDKIGGAPPAAAGAGKKSIDDPKFLQTLFNKTPQHFKQD